jgi:hypothetical protein
MAGIILWRKKILGKDRKQKEGNNSLEENLLGRDIKQKAWNNSCWGKR